MNPTIDDSTRVFQRATQWLSDLQDGNADSADLFRWLAESPRHVEEFALALSFTDEIAGLTEEQCAAIAAMNAAQRERPIVVPLVSPGLIRDGVASVVREVTPLDSGRSIPERTRSRAKRLYAAAAVLLGLIGGLLWWDNGWRTYKTDFGEQRVVDLADGSVVTLNTDSRIKVRFGSTSRDIRMISGEALFKVQPDAEHPFRVHADASIIQAVGTQFNVYRRARGTTVSVLEGRVRITPHAGVENNSSIGTGAAAPLSAQHLSVGQEAEIESKGRIVMREIDPRQTATWRQRKLVFNNDALSDIAAEFNRYNRRPQIRIGDEQAGKRRFAATFDADAPEALVKVLESEPQLAIERVGDEIIVRSR